MYISVWTITTRIYAILSLSLCPNKSIAQDKRNTICFDTFVIMAHYWPHTGVGPGRILSFSDDFLSNPVDSPNLILMLSWSSVLTASYCVLYWPESKFYQLSGTIYVFALSKNFFLHFQRTNNALQNQISFMNFETMWFIIILMPHFVQSCHWRIIFHRDFDKKNCALYFY